MPLRKCMEETTYSEYLMWMDYLSEQWDKPNRTDYYLMQVASEVRKVLAKNRREIKLNDFLIRFGLRKPSKQEVSKKAMSDWQGILATAKKKD